MNAVFFNRYVSIFLPFLVVCGIDRLDAQQFSVGGVSSKYFRTLGSCCDPVPKAAVIPGKVDWYVNDGWVYREGDRFFPIGLWNIPGYKPLTTNLLGSIATAHSIDTSLVETNVLKSNEARFDTASQIFNLIHVRKGRVRPYMHEYMEAESETIFFTGHGHFNWRMKKKDSVLGIDGGWAGRTLKSPPSIRWGTADFTVDTDSSGVISYEEMMDWRNRPASQQDYYKEDYFRNIVVDGIVREFGDNKNFIFLTADEPNSRFTDTGWYLHPDQLSMYRDAVAATTTTEGDSSLTFVDLFGSMKADLYTWERILGTANLPANLSDHQVAAGDTLAFPKGDVNLYETFQYADNSLSKFRDKTGSTWNARPPLTFRGTYYETIKKTAEAYNSTGHIIGLNAYEDFKEYPEAASIAVEAIKDASPGVNKPVWLFFDGGSLKNIGSNKMSDDEYIRRIRTQVYTAIAAGATGILFFSRSDLEVNEIDTAVTQYYNPTYWNLLKEVAKELKEKSNIFKGNVLSQGKQGTGSHLHYSIRSTGGNEYLIVSNTDTLQSQTFQDTSGRFANVTLAPWEVRVQSLIKANTTWTDTVRMLGDVTVNSGIKLTVSPGTLVQVEGDHDLIVSGTIDAIGNTTQNIIFRSSDPAPTSQDWHGIQIEDTGIGKFDFCQISDAVEGIEGTYADTLIIDNTTISNCIYGVYLSGTDGIIRDCTIKDNTTGISSRNGSHAIVDHSLILYNYIGTHTTQTNSSVTLTNVTVDGNDENGVEAQSNTGSQIATVTMKNTAVTNSGTNGVAVVGTDGPNMVFNVSYSNVYSPYGPAYNNTSDLTPYDGNMSVDPEYTSNSDYTLGLYSHIMDAGDPNDNIGSEPTTGLQRIDIGRYGGTAQGSSSNSPFSNGDFESSNPWWNSTRYQASSGITWERLQNHPGKNSSYYITTCDSTHTGGGCANSDSEEHTGLYRSNRFQIPTNAKDYLSFLVAGYSGELCDRKENYARLRRATDDAALLDTLLVPCRNDLVYRSWDISTLEETWVYIELKDDDNDGGYAWMRYGQMLWMTTERIP